MRRGYATTPGLQEALCQACAEHEDTTDALPVSVDTCARCGTELPSPNGASTDRYIPVDVLADRGPLSPLEALAYWLCDDPDGPELAQADAAAWLDSERSQVSTVLGRARRKLDEGST